MSCNRLINNNILHRSIDHRSTQPPPRFLLVDATNILSRAASDAKRWKHASHSTTSSSFHDWIDFLLITVQPDGLIAVFDNPDVSSRRRQSIDPQYQRRRIRQQPQSINNQAHKLTPFIKTVEEYDKAAKQSNTTECQQEMHALALIAQQGFEADDLMYTLCHHITLSSVLNNDNNANIVIASGDSDMQGLLSFNQVSWLEVLQLPSTCHPAALALHTATSFEKQYKFHPESYYDYLSLVGKKGSGVGGVGIGTKSASSLLARFKSIDGIQHAAKKGLLKGWGPAVTRVFQPGSNEMKKVRKNVSLLHPLSVTIKGKVEEAHGCVAKDAHRIAVTAHAEVFTASQQENIRRFLEDIAYQQQKNTLYRTDAIDADDWARCIHSHATAWHHPLNLGRWRRTQQSIRLFQQMLQEVPRENNKLVYRMVETHTCIDNMPVDLSLTIEVLDDQESSQQSHQEILILERRKAAIMLCCECDFDHANGSIEHIKHLNIAKFLEATSAHDVVHRALLDSISTENASSYLVDPFRILPYLNAAMKHHINLLRKQCLDESCIMCIFPGWLVD